MRTVKFVCLTRSRDRNDARAERAVGFAQSIANDLLGFFLRLTLHTQTHFLPYVIVFALLRYVSVFPVLFRERFCELFFIPKEVRSSRSVWRDPVETVCVNDLSVYVFAVCVIRF